MFFTREDYKKIENWLKNKSIKDTEFLTANNLTGEELIVIVQDGENKKVHLKDITVKPSSYIPVYKSNIEDKSTEMPVTYGSLEAGTTVGEIEGFSYNKLFDLILFGADKDSPDSPDIPEDPEIPDTPTPPDTDVIYPTFVAPSVDLRPVETGGLLEIGTPAPTKDDFIVIFDRGGIYLNDEFQDYRSGELDEEKSFIFMNENEQYPVELPTIVDRNLGYFYKAYYKEGPQPKDSNGNNYDTPLQEGSVISSMQFYKAAYPWFASTEGATADNLIKQTLKGGAVEPTRAVTLQSTIKCPQIFEIPEEADKISVLEPMSNTFVDASLDVYKKTEITKDLNGIIKNYYRYEYDSAEYGDRGEITLRIYY